MTSFPVDISIFNKIVEVFNQTRSYVLLLFPLAFFLRIAFGFIFLKGPESFIDILKDSLFLFLGLFFFTDILRLTLQIPYFVSSELSFGEWKNINLGEGFFTKFLRRLVDWIGIISYWISFGLYVAIISILGFFAAYILFLGTMFRAYGMLKVFFILLFVVSLWPLLWHSINFAVFTIAVSDNAFANNVIVGGASLAKVILPIWLISKTSKMPVSENLKKISYFGGGLAYTGGSGTYSFLKDKTENIFQKVETIDEGDIEEGAEIDVTETNEVSHSNVTENYPYSEHISEPEDFSIREREPGENSKDTIEVSNEEDNLQDIEIEEEESSVSKENHITQESHIEENLSEETSVENQVTSSVQNNSSPQVVNETKSEIAKENHSADIPSQSQSENQIQNESSVTNPQIQNESTVQETQVKEQTSTQLNENIHKENWIEREESVSKSNQDQKEEESES